jgi:hypothetical protein
MQWFLLRGILGALCVLFAAFLGRSVIRRQEGIERPAILIGWALRVIITGAAVFFRAGFDRISIPTLGLAVLSFLAGAYIESRPKQHEELEKVMFPPE